MSAEIQRTEIDGVPFFWMHDGPRQMAHLAFRVGRGDEPFRLAGITHLLEHLAFHRIGERKFAINGSVDHVETEFVTFGVPEENGAFLGDITAALQDVDADRLQHEAKVLRVESQRRGASSIREYIGLRYGTATLGRSALDEHALHVATAADLRGWAEHWFTRGNAVGWMAHEPPAGMRLTLPDGPRRPIVQHRDISPLPLPSWGPTQMPGAMVGAPVPRSAASVTFGRILRNRTERRLRRELGLSYDVTLAYMKLNRDEALAMVIASSSDEESGRAADELMALLEQLAREGPTADELADDLDQMRRANADPMRPLGALHYAAACELDGYPYLTPEELEAEAAALRVEDVQTAASWFRANAVGFSKRVKPLNPPWHPYPVWSASAVTGRTFDSVKKKYPWTKGTPSMVVSGEGLSLVTPEGKAVTVRYESLAGVLRFKDRRILYGEDGFRLNVDPAEWKGGGEVVDAVDRAVPPAEQVAWQS